MRNKGGSGSSLTKCKKFNKVLDDCNILDIGYVGPKFTICVVNSGKDLIEFLVAINGELTS